jgi:L-asparaginase
VVFTGGTISMLPDPVTGAAVPRLDGYAVLARTPGVAAIAEVEPIDWGLVPASHLRFGQLIELSRLLTEQLARPGVAGAVVVQGTDVMEETAFAFDLLVGSPRPVVVVGAMRNAADPDFDGPRNLRDAVLAASSPAMVGQGTCVMMGGRILPADDVVKLHASALDALGAPNLGPIGRVDDGRVIVERRRGVRRALSAIPERAAEPIALITAVVSTDGSLLRAATRMGAAGIVVAATGSGNTDPDLLAAAVEAMGAGIPVVLTTRCPAGGVSPGYGFPGGGATWAAAGAILAGTLSAPKARVALALGLGGGLDRARLRALIGGDAGA